MKYTQIAIGIIQEVEHCQVTVMNAEHSLLKMNQQMRNMMTNNESSATFVLELGEQDYIPVSEGGQMLITIFDNKICRVAWRAYQSATWGPPVEGEKRD